MTSIAPTINQLVDKGQAFALWNLPNSSKIELLIAQEDGVCFLNDESELDNRHGFVFAPFQQHLRCPLVLLEGNHLIGQEAIKNVDINSLPFIDTPAYQRHISYIIDKEQYINDINTAILAIAKGCFSKVIMSRILAKARNGEPLGDLFVRLAESAPKAFVYLFHVPQVGIWMGATPEILMQQDNERAETMSLAGTQTLRADSDYSWKTKEIEEQAFVSRYILEAFYELDIHPYQTKGPETLECGQIAHLKTSFSFDASLIDKKHSKFVRRMHPTPAVCGLPKRESQYFISEIEKHQRRYYTGYLGAWNLNNTYSLYVNLRCMEITSNLYLLYVGGGITQQSVAEDEWQETQRKAEVILNIL